MSTTVTDRSALQTGDASRNAAAIAVRDLWKRYGSLEAVRGISFEVEHGEIFGLIGADGAGKTTSFQILAGVMEATKGTAQIFGKPAREARAQTGYLTPLPASLRHGSFLFASRRPIKRWHEAEARPGLRPRCRASHPSPR
jgi:ABC-type glutathione transport system ATPase component